MRFGWIPDQEDRRDYRFVPPIPQVTLPPKFAVPTPFVYDQGNLGSCTANAVCALFQLTEIEEVNHGEMPARLALYWYTRSDQGTVSYDSGATIRGTIKAAANHGICRESTDPYQIAKFTQKPSMAARVESYMHRLASASYARVNQSLQELKASIYAGNPIAFGWTVYESFMTSAVTRTGIMPMPKDGEAIKGGHATLMVGWDDGMQAFLVLNSWGLGWGQKGLFYMPYAFALSQAASDFWTITKVVAF